MLTPQEIVEIIETMHPLLDGLNAWITKDLIKRVMARLGRGEDFVLTSTDEWQLQVYQAAGGHLEAMQQEIARFTKRAAVEVHAIFEDAGIRAFEHDNAFYVAHGLPEKTLAQSENMIQLLTDTYQRTNGEIRNFTRTTATASQKRLVEVLDTAHFKVMSGATSYTQAVKEAVNDLVSNQTKVHYPTGHVDTIETAVLRAVRTGVAQASGNMAIEGMKEREWDLVRVTAHIGARYGDGGENPGNHFWWQGKLYSRTGKTPGYPLFEESTGYGTGEGLCGWNCRHSFGPGDPDHNPFKEFDSEENKKVFDLSQKQRSAEARIRRTKTKLLGLREAINAAEDPTVKATLEDEYGKAARLLRKQNAFYNEFCEKNKLKKLSDRLSVAKWTRSEAARATAAARKASGETSNKQ